MQVPDPTAEHQWLHQLVGQWEYQHECNMGPDAPPVKSVGKQVTRKLGEFWVIGELAGEMPGGGEAISIITLGFDPAQGRFVGSFVSSCMSHLWSYNGSLDADRKILTLDCEGPSFTGEGTAKYQDIIEVIDADHHTLSSQTLNPDGSWTRFMHGKYKRV